MIFRNDSLKPARERSDEGIRFTPQDFLAGGADQQDVCRFADGRAQVYVAFAVARRHRWIRLDKGWDAERQTATVKDDRNSTDDMTIARLVGPNPAGRYADQKCRAAKREQISLRGAVKRG